MNPLLEQSVDSWYVSRILALAIVLLKWSYVAPSKDKTQEAPSEDKDKEEAGTHSIAGFSPRVITDLLSSCPPSRTEAKSMSLRTCWPP